MQAFDSVVVVSASCTSHVLFSYVSRETTRDDRIQNFPDLTSRFYLHNFIRRRKVAAIPASKEGMHCTITVVVSCPYSPKAWADDRHCHCVLRFFSSEQNLANFLAMKSPWSRVESAISGMGTTATILERMRGLLELQVLQARVSWVYRLTRFPFSHDNDEQLICLTQVAVSKFRPTLASGALVEG